MLEVAGGAKARHFRKAFTAGKINQVHGEATAAPAVLQRTTCFAGKRKQGHQHVPAAKCHADCLDFDHEYQGFREERYLKRYSITPDARKSSLPTGARVVCDHAVRGEARGETLWLYTKAGLIGASRWKDANPVDPLGRAPAFVLDRLQSSGKPLVRAGMNTAETA